jgi:hypothetical protein
VKHGIAREADGDAGWAGGHTEASHADVVAAVCEEALDLVEATCPLRRAGWI